MSRDLGNGDFEVGYVRGAEHEQERIIELLADFWCGEPACTKHPVRMDWVINKIKGVSNES